MRLALVALLPLLLVSCRSPARPQGQVVLHLDTDAPVPGGDVPALFDRMRVDVYTPSATSPCAECTRTFEIDLATLQNRRASIGILEEPGRAGYRVRVRMFRGIAVQDGEPNADSTVEVIAGLPVVAADGIVDCSLLLHTDDVAHPVGSLDAPASVTMGSPSSTQVGTWPGGKRTPCPDESLPDEVCVPGGAFWMGNPEVVYGSGEHAEANHQRLVVVSPFHLDAHEMTVAEHRAIATGKSDVVPWTGSHEGSSLDDWCTYTTAASANDPLPINCVYWTTARRDCQAKGGDLPTESQFEYAASRLMSARYVWGSDAPTCDGARYAQAGLGATFGNADDCWNGVDFGGPLASVRAREDRDRLDLAGGTIVDLAGNLGEWARDAWDPQDGACWGSGVLVDPTCRPDQPSGVGVVRGGSWNDAALALHPAYRASYKRNERLAFVGFRCARP